MLKPVLNSAPLFSSHAESMCQKLEVFAGGFFGGDRVSVTPELRVRVGNTLSYSFSPRVFVQSLLQYNDRANIWSSNVRFGWLQQANTGVFLVDTDSHLQDESAFRPSNALWREVQADVRRPEVSSRSFSLTSP